MATLSSAQLKGLTKLGDVMIPGGTSASGRVYPSFSEAGCAVEVRRMLPFMYPGDRGPLLALFTTCSVLPTPVIKALVAMVAGHARAPEPVAGVLRLANLGLKGVIHSLYYSKLNDPRIHELLSYNPGINVHAYETHLATLNNESD